MKVTPKIKTHCVPVCYADLGSGDTFLYNNELYIKGGGEQTGTCLNDGGYITNMCKTQVIPVNAEVTWSYKDKKGKKK